MMVIIAIGEALPDHALSGEHTQLVQVTVQVGGIPKNPKRACSNQLVLTVAAAQKSDA